jgi:subtilisin family serine protease
MKKILVSILLISMLFLITSMPVPISAGASTAPNLKFNVTPAHEEFIEECTHEPLPAVPGYYLPYDVDMVNGEYCVNGGQGVYIAVLDTGLVSDWASFLPPTANIRTDLGRGWSYDVVWNPSINDFDWTPNENRGFITNNVGSGHGTHVTSTIVGYQRSTIGVTPHIVLGVAPKATIIPLLGLDYWLLDCPDPTYPGYHAGKVMFGGGDDWMLCSAIDYVTSLAVAHRSWKIICTNSWGSSEPSPAIRASIDKAIKKGVIFTFAAGNRGSAQMDWPGAYPEVISAAAGGWTMEQIGYPPSNPPSPYRWYLTDVPENLNTANDPMYIAYGLTGYENDQQMYLTTFSGRPNTSLGQCKMDLDVCAPGCYVVGPFKPEAAWDDVHGVWVNIGAGTAYYGLWGTSMATPHVAAVAAIVWQYNSRLDQCDMESILKVAAMLTPMHRRTEYAVDPYGPEFALTDHDAGAGWLTADNALFVAFIYTHMFHCCAPCVNGKIVHYN